MAKKFFYNKVHNTKKTIINLVIIGVCIIGIIICFIVTSNFQGENKVNGELSLKSEVTIEVNENFNVEIFFSKISNVDLNKIKITYPDNYDKSIPGTYQITLTIDKKDYNTNLKIVDTKKPELKLKELIINENQTYNAKEFVTSCTDNSGKDCNIEFYAEDLNDDGQLIDYSNYTKEGIYPIKIVAKDSSNNQTVLETSLIIKKENEDKPPITESPSTCKYGNNSYDKDSYILALDISNGGCAVSFDTYYNKNDEIDKITETETVRIIKDIDKLNLQGKIYVTRNITAIPNLTNEGIVGYELEIIYKLENEDSSEIVAKYKLDVSGNRNFSINKYNIES